MQDVLNGMTQIRLTQAERKYRNCFRRTLWIRLSTFQQIYTACGQLKACLDLVATNATNLHFTSLASLGKSDHVVLKGNFPTLTVPTTKRACKRLVWCWNRANIDGLQQAIASEKWDYVMACKKC